MNEYCGYPTGDCVLAQGDKKIIDESDELKKENSLLKAELEELKEILSTINVWTIR